MLTLHRGAVSETLELERSKPDVLNSFERTLSGVKTTLSVGALRQLTDGLMTPFG
jgi:hypothetical protein